MKIPISYFNVTWNDISRLELKVYSDASEEAFVATTYRVGYKGEVIHQNKSFVMGKAKVVPKMDPQFQE